MTVYQFRDTATAASGSTSKSTLKIQGGLLSHLIIRANTDTTVFRASITDDSSLNIWNWGFSKGEINDNAINIPVSGTYTFNITNASPDDTFTIYAAVRER